MGSSSVRIVQRVLFSNWILFSISILESRFYRFNHVHLLLRQKCADVEGFRVKHCHHWSGIFNFRSNFNFNPRDTSMSEDEEKQRVLSDHNEFACDIISVKFVVYCRCSIDQESTSVWDDSSAPSLLIPNNVSVVLCLYLHYLRPNNQRVAEAENAVHIAHGLCGADNIRDGESTNFQTLISIQRLFS